MIAVFVRWRCSKMFPIILFDLILFSVGIASVVITNEEGNKVPDVIGPINEGSHLSLACETSDDAPSVVTWWKGPFLLDDTFVTMPEGIVRNELIVSSLHRNDYMAAFTCQASLPNFTQPSETSVSVDLNLLPLDVHIITLQRPLSAGHEVELLCQSRGSKPPAVLTWWLGVKHLLNTTNTSFNDVSASTLSFVPAIEDNGRVLSCRASNPMLNGSILEDHWVLNIYYVPELIVIVGAPEPQIKEGDDVYFDCNIQANPSITQIGWKFNGKTLYSHHIDGVKVNNQSLLLRKVTRKSTGNYTCVAANAEGEGKSGDVYLDVQYLPSCLPNQKLTYGVPLHKSVEIKCSVDANPVDLSFDWHWNSSLKHLPIKRFATNGTQSILVFTPKRKSDYGYLFCRAQNIVGIQKDACCFKVSPAGIPSAVENCKVGNETLTSLQISCDPGFNGGLMQTFHLELYTIRGLHSTLINKEAPEFKVGNLVSSVSYIGLVFSTNSLGRSNSVALTAKTLSYRKREGMKHMFISPLIGTLIVIIGSLVVISIVIVLGVRHHDHDAGLDRRVQTQHEPAYPPYAFEATVGAFKPSQYI